MEGGRRNTIGGCERRRAKRKTDLKEKLTTNCSFFLLAASRLKTAGKGGQASNRKKGPDSEYYNLT